MAHRDALFFENRLSQTYSFFFCFLEPSASETTVLSSIADMPSLELRLIPPRFDGLPVQIILYLEE